MKNITIEDIEKAVWRDFNWFTRKPFNSLQYKGVVVTINEYGKLFMYPYHTEIPPNKVSEHSILLLTHEICYKELTPKTILHTCDDITRLIVQEIKQRSGVDLPKSAVMEFYYHRPDFLLFNNGFVCHVRPDYTYTTSFWYTANDAHAKFINDLTQASQVFFLKNKPVGPMTKIKEILWRNRLWNPEQCDKVNFETLVDVLNYSTVDLNVRQFIKKDTYDVEFNFDVVANPVWFKSNTILLEIYKEGNQIESIRLNSY